MSTHITAAYALAVLGFAVGVALAARLATVDDADTDRGKFAYLLAIPGFAGLMYIVMALDVGVLTVGSETIVLPRYVDWLVTTPLLVGYVGYVAGAPRRWIAGVMAADAGMIAAGAVATVTTGPTKWAFFAISGGFHLSLFYVLYRVLPTYARNFSKRRGLFKLLQNHIGLLWVAYPLVWLVGAPGLGYVSAAGITLIIIYLDVVAKVPYIYFVWNRRYCFDRDAAESTMGSGAQPTPAGPGGASTADD
ncbi:rhodopsin [Halobellus salinus]|uniref:Rhodopsin n=1 Tax=Halobellus salinus TaxID=931585 RepID=A0A830ES07_9EURY|nr:bacteriorhodopsin [Halobellus salinus]GGJ16023.1 rhodopsin [Halobellus salinus]SMP31363.1 sensory rhodopsin [Halobellus salinus]